MLLFNFRMPLGGFRCTYGQNLDKSANAQTIRRAAKITKEFAIAVKVIGKHDFTEIMSIFDMPTASEKTADPSVPTTPL